MFNNGDLIKEVKKISGIETQLEHIESKKIGKIEKNLLELGCKCDGVTDDTIKFQKALDEANTFNYDILIPYGVCLITDTLLVPSNVRIRGLGDKSIIKFKGKGWKDGMRFYLFHVLGEKGGTPKSNITFKDFKIDCTEQEFKGGVDVGVNAKITSPKPYSAGMDAFFCQYCTNLTFDGLTINDVYGDGIIAWNTSFSRVVNCRLYDCGGGNPEGQGNHPTTYDSFGDGITFFRSFAITISDNVVVNKRKYLVEKPVTSVHGNYIGLPCGRSGIEYEYEPTSDTPFFDEFKNDNNAFALRINNNFVSGYTKGVHLEISIKTFVTNNDVINNHIGIIYADYGNLIVNGNTFQTTLPPAPQAGYDLQWSGISCTPTTGFKRNGVIISNNLFEGRCKGVHLQQTKAIVNGNRFAKECEYAISMSEKNTGTIISNNSIFSPIFVYQSKNTIFSGNIFMTDELATDRVIGSCSSVSKIKFIGNNIINYGLNITNFDYCDFTNNTVIVNKDLPILTNHLPLGFSATNTTSSVLKLNNNTIESDVSRKLIDINTISSIEIRGNLLKENGAELSGSTSSQENTLIKVTYIKNIFNFSNNQLSLSSVPCVVCGVGNTQQTSNITFENNIGQLPTDGILYLQATGYFSGYKTFKNNIGAFPSTNYTDNIFLTDGTNTYKLNVSTNGTLSTTKINL